MRSGGIFGRICRLARTRCLVRTRHFLNDAEIQKFAETGTGMTHCPSANMRCGQGIAKIRQMRAAGVKVGLGVDGSASNDTSNMFMEARLAQMLQRVAPARYLSEPPGGPGGFGGSPKALSARDALEMATRGGAALLGRDDIGMLAPGMSADFIAVKRNQLGLSGTQRDPARGVDHVRTVQGRLLIHQRSRDYWP